MTNSRTFTLIILLSIFMKRSQTRGDQASETQQNAVKQLTEFKELTFMEGSNVTLQCGNVTDVTWNEFIYIVWNISLQSKKCYIGLSPNLDNTCNDKKGLYNSSDEVSLTIFNISLEDEGFYSCDFSYKGGSRAVNVSVRVTQLSTSLETKNNQRFAVCEAKPKMEGLTLRWESYVNLSVENFSNNTFSKSRVNLDDYDVTPSEITCVATYPSGSGSGYEQKRNTIHLKESSSQNSLFTTIAISVGCVCFILISLAMVYVLHRKLNSISTLKMLCCKSKVSPPAEDKPPQPIDVEEVEPYASYIQRVNSIYNSSAELFNA